MMTEKREVGKCGGGDKGARKGEAARWKEWVGGSKVRN